MGNVKIGPAETRQRSPSGWPYIPNATLPVRPKPQAGVPREGRTPTGRSREAGRPNTVRARRSAVIQRRWTRNWACRRPSRLEPEVSRTRISASSAPNTRPVAGGTVSRSTSAFKRRPDHARLFPTHPPSRCLNRSHTTSHPVNNQISVTGVQNVLLARAVQLQPLPAADSRDEP